MTTSSDIAVGAAAALDEAEAALGGRVAFCRALRVTSSAVGNWKKRGVPVKACVCIERLTAGKVLRSALRPADFVDIWPELAQSAAGLAGSGGGG